MASGPFIEPNKYRKKHARNVTIPALPLSLSDQIFQRPSQPTTQPTSIEGTSSHHEVDQGPDVVAEAQQENDHVSQTQEEVTETSPAREVSVEPLQPVDASPVTEPLAAIQRTAPITSNEEPAASEQLSGEPDTSFQYEATDSAEPAVEYLAVGSSPNHLYDAQQASETCQSTVQNEQYGDQTTATADEARTVRLSDESTQASDHGASSTVQSQTTVTDYDSPYAESSLETVVAGPQPSRKSSLMPHRQSEVAPEVLTNGHSSHAQQDIRPPHITSASIASINATMPNIHDHLVFLATTKQFCDTVLQVNQADRAYQPSLHYAHSLLLLRSPRLTKVMSDLDPQTQPRLIQLNPARNVLPHAFEAALRFFYYDHVPGAESLMPEVAHPDRLAKEQVFEYVMSYWMAGVELGIDAIKQSCYDVVKRLVDWDIAELVAKEAQELRMAEESMLNDLDKIEIRSIANTLSHLVSQLFIEQLNVNDFRLDPLAQTTIMPPRFAQLDPNRTTNPVLSSMQFGSLPSQGLPNTDSSSTASAVLLNMDFAGLQMFAAELIGWHGTEGEELVRKVIQEREDRRDQVISNRAIPNKERLSSSALWDMAGLRESIQDGQIQRERVGFLLPTKFR